MGFTSTLTADAKAFALRAPAVLSAATLLVVAYLIRYLINRPKRLNLRIIGENVSNFGPKELLGGSGRERLRLIHNIGSHC
jgi:hypothetical protein